MENDSKEERDPGSSSPNFRQRRGSGGEEKRLVEEENVDTSRTDIITEACHRMLTEKSVLEVLGHLRSTFKVRILISKQKGPPKLGARI